MKSQSEHGAEEDKLTGTQMVVGCEQEEGNSVSHTAGEQFLKVGKVGREIEKTQFSRTLERHKIIAEN